MTEPNSATPPQRQRKAASTTVKGEYGSAKDIRGPSAKGGNRREPPSTQSTEVKKTASKSQSSYDVSVESSWTDTFSNKSVDFINKEAVEYFVRSAKASGRMPDTMNPEPEAILRRFGMVSGDRKITLAAALLFGKPNDAVNGSIVKIGKFSDKGELIKEEIIDLPVIMQPDAVIKALFEKFIPAEFEFADSGSVIINKYPRRAVREAVVNAVVHKRYEYREPVLVIVGTNSIEVYNPGELPHMWTAEDLVKKHHSVRYNERMAEVFHEAGLLGSWGRGIGKMCEACRENGNPQPEFTIRHGGLEVLFSANKEEGAPRIGPEKTTGPAGSTVSEGKSAGPQQSSIDFSGPFKRSDAIFYLSESEKVICKMIAENARITVGEMAVRSKLSERQIYRIVKDLTEKKILERKGSRKSGVWVFCEEE